VLHLPTPLPQNLPSIADVWYTPDYIHDFLMVIDVYLRASHAVEAGIVLVVSVRPSVRLAGWLAGWLSVRAKLRHRHS